MRVKLSLVPRTRRGDAARWYQTSLSTASALCAQEGLLPPHLAPLAHSVPGNVACKVVAVAFPE